MNKLMQCQKGQSMVELALVLPVLILLLLCIMEGGRILAGYLELESAARDGARYASINTTVPNSDVKNYIKTRLTLLDGTKLDGTNGDGSNADGSWNCEVIRSSIGSGTSEEKQVEVSLRYPLNIITPIIRDILNDPFYLQTKIVMRSE